MNIDSTNTAIAKIAIRQSTNKLLPNGDVKDINQRQHEHQARR